MPFTGNENHDITFADAGAMTKKYRTTIQVGDTLGGFFGEKAILEILSQKNCVGIRYYYGFNDKGEKVLVLVGVDANENDLVDEAIGNVCKEISFLCPPRCSTPNILNS